MVEFEKALDGIVKYIDSELLPKMNDVQEFTARVLIGRVINNTNNIKETITNNGYIRTFGIIDNEGMVDIEGLAKDIKREIIHKGKVAFNVPMFGKMTFVPSDVDVLHKMICGKDMEHNDYN